MPIRVLTPKEESILPRSFYARKTDVVARELLGKLIVHNSKAGVMAAKIVETEAYFGNGDDPASHAHNGPTPRSAIMFEKSGCAYVYFNYGVHWLLNFVAKEESQAMPIGRQAGAVLIRAVQPVEGIELMLKNRPAKASNLTNGPAKLTKALGIDGSFNGMDITKSDSQFYVADLLTPTFQVLATPRIGINRGTEKQLRFYIKNNAFVSV